jgi:hypothetical protein
MNGNITFLSPINVSNNSTLQGITVLSILNVSGISILQGDTTFLSNLNVNNNFLVNNNTTLKTNLFVNNYTILNNNTTINTNLNVINNTILNGASTLLSQIYISGNSVMQGTTSCLSNLNISGTSIMQNNVTMMSQVNVLGNANFSSINISGNSIFNNNVTMLSPVSVLNNFTLLGQVSMQNIPDFPTNAAAAAGGVALWSIYRTGGIIKIRLDDIAPSLSLLPLNGNINITINQLTVYYEPGATSLDNVNGNLIPYITSINSVDTGELVNTPIPLATTNIPLSLVNTNLPRVYTITYISTDSSGNYQNAYRTLTIRSLIRTLLFNNTNIYQASYAIPNDFINNNLVNGFKTAWTISNSGLQSLGFTFNNSWQIIMKGQITTNINPMIEFSFDPSLIGWPTTRIIHSGRYVVELGGPRAGGINYGWLQNPDNTTSIFATNNNLMTCLRTGFYVQIKYYNNSITLIFLDLSGNIVYTWISPSITYINNITPFVIYMDVNTCDFYNGILYDITNGNTASYLDFKSNFNIS